MAEVKLPSLSKYFFSAFGNIKNVNILLHEHSKYQYAEKITQDFFFPDNQTGRLISYSYVSMPVYSIPFCQRQEKSSHCTWISTLPLEKKLRLGNRLASNIFKIPPDMINERE